MPFFKGKMKGKQVMKSYKIKQQKRNNYEGQEYKCKGHVRINPNECSESAKRKKIKLVVHHLKELENYSELALEIDNLETVCVNC